MEAPPSERQNPIKVRLGAYNCSIEESGVIETPKRRQSWLFADFDGVVECAC